MQSNNVKTFKIETTGNAAPVADNTAPAANGTPEDPFLDNIENVLDSAFGDGSWAAPTTTGEAVVYSSAIDPYVLSDPRAQVVTGTESSGIDVLTNYPPTLDEILAGNEQAARYIDVIKQRYETAKTDLLALRDSYLAALPDVSSAEGIALQEKIALINLALVKCDQQIEACVQRMDSDSGLFIEEKRLCRDLNGDGLIGRPGAAGTIGVVADDDGILHYVDTITGQAIKFPLQDPEYSAQITKDDSLVMLADQTEAVDYNPDDPSKMEAADVYLKLNGLRENYESPDNPFGCPIDISIPEYLWVQREEGTNDPAVDYESEVAKYKFDSSLLDGAGGISQSVPEDLSKYVQVRVAKCEVFSKPNPATEGFFTYIDFKDAEDNIITRVRIEGCEQISPASSPMRSFNYFDPSSVGLSFNGDQRSSPIIFDASKYKSTGRHILDSFAGTLGIEAPAGGPVNPEEEDLPEYREGMSGDQDYIDQRRTFNERAAFDENRAAFEGASFNTLYWSGTEASSKMSGREIHTDASTGTGSISNAPPYVNYHDRYVSEEPGANDTLRSFKTGVFLRGLRGNLTLSNYNDICKVPDANWLSPYAEEHQLPGAEPIRSTDSEYNTVVDGKSGNNAVVAGSGNLYAKSVSFGWVEAGNDDRVEISVAEEASSSTRTPDDIEESIDSVCDPKNFVKVEGAGNITLYDFGEQNESGNASYYEGLNNDYYSLSGGSIYVSKPSDADIDADGVRLSADANAAGNNVTRDQIFGDTAKLIEDAILGFGDDFAIDPPTEWLDSSEGSASAEQDAEMDTFFNDMFGDMSEFQTEIENS